ncbi:hypothetical protein EDB86DRAFT_2806486 [Lactarius hatsudake]|nr:hypothetical protein EDB86DRAFT_2806486 [Lactarius hatsudake]
MGENRNNSTILSVSSLFNNRHCAATSTAVEQLFSQGQQLLHFTRSQLSPAMIHTFLCFGDWSQKGVVDMNDIIAGICKSRLGRKRSLSESSRNGVNS